MSAFINGFADELIKLAEDPPDIIGWDIAKHTALGAGIGTGLGAFLAHLQGVRGVGLMIGGALLGGATGAMRKNTQRIMDKHKPEGVPRKEWRRRVDRGAAQAAVWKGPFSFSNPYGPTAR